ncbi:MAG: LPP20 family lipoprotein [Candidatus Sericytochromatia bacterium]|nr:LPP20 family lipoprotein [Candidatus Sericytochromatia bacterium]
MKTSRHLIKLMVAAALATGTLSYSLSTLSPAQAQVTQNMGSGTIDWTSGNLKVTGSGAPPSKGSAAQKRLMARRAAVADGYRQMAELINGVRVDSETIVKDFVTESDTIKIKVSALIKGAQIGDTRYLSDGSVEVDMRLGMYGANSLSSVIQPTFLEEHKQEQIAPTPTRTPVPTPVKTPTIPDEPVVDNGDSYTGLIIDCKGLGVAPGMSPMIMDSNGKEVYIGDRPIDPDMVVQIGIVGYLKTMSEARASSRVGKNPLVIRASSAGGKTKVDAVISSSQAQMLLQADSRKSFLAESKVVFIID